MGLDLRLQQKMAQQLVMTPQLQQAIKLLQLSHLEMADALREELEQNPLLEERFEGENEGGDNAAEGDEGGGSSGLEASTATDEGGIFEAGSAGDERAMAEHDTLYDAGSAADAPIDATPEPTAREVDHETDWDSYGDAVSYGSAPGGHDEELPTIDATLQAPTSLWEHLRFQAQMAGFSHQELKAAILLIEDVNEDGYLPADALDNVAEELGIDVADIFPVLHAVQEFDPPGVCARNLSECLLAQLRELCRDDDLVRTIVERFLPQVQVRALPAIARELGVSIEQVANAVQVISKLEPRPGRIFAERQPQYIVPDIYVTYVGGDYVVSLNDEGLPRLRISNLYQGSMGGTGSSTKTYIQEKLRSAAWLIRSIQMRQRTIYRVMQSILTFQRDFFDKGAAHLKPLILREVAEDVSMHESTISRVTSNKYVHTPRGIYELKFFFNSSINRVDGNSIASESVRTHIERLIGGEDPRAPYSDQKIVEILKSYDIDIARRTVAKYREMLKIASSSKRKRFF